MLKAVLRNGVIFPLEPMPATWQEGQQLKVDVADQSPKEPDDGEKWFRELDALCRQGNPEQDEQLQKALRAAHEKAKKWSGRKWDWLDGWILARQ